MRKAIKTSSRWRKIRTAFPNLLTLGRFCLIAPLCGAINNGRVSLIVTFFLAIAATDFLDGRFARAWNAQSRLGAILDAIADLAYILAASYTMVTKGQLPPWFPLLIAVKFGEFTITSSVIAKASGGRNILVYDRIGRIGACFFFIIPGLIPTLSEIGMPNFRIMIGAIVIVTTILTVCSSIGRISICARNKKLIGSRYLWTRSN